MAVRRRNRNAFSVTSRPPVLQQITECLYQRTVSSFWWPCVEIAKPKLWTWTFRKETYRLSCMGFTMIMKLETCSKKAFEKLDTVFSFVAAFIGGPMGEQHRHNVTHVHTTFLELCHLLDHRDVEHVLATQSLNRTRDRIKNFRILLRNTVHAYCQTGLYSLKLHQLDHFVEKWVDFGVWDCPVARRKKTSMFT